MKAIRGLLFTAGIVYFSLAIRSGVIENLPGWITLGFVGVVGMLGAALVMLPLDFKEAEKKTLILGYVTGAFVTITGVCILLLLLAGRDGGFAIRLTRLM